MSIGFRPSPATRDLGRFMGRRRAATSTTAMRAALEEGPGVLTIPPGRYVMGEVAIPPGVAVVGSGRSTVLVSDGSPSVFSASKSSGWAIRDLVIDGGATGDWRERSDRSRDGVRIDACTDFDVRGVTVRNFEGAGVRCSNTTTFCPRGFLRDISAHGNFCGVHFDFRGEYLNASSFACENNVYGCIIHAGNVSLSDSIFCSNTYGVYIEDKENGSHGVISGCLVNHNDFPLHCRRVLIGMAIVGCSFFTGTMILEDSVGVDISSGIVSCSVRSIGSGANRIAGNYMRLRDDCSFDFAPRTIVEGNFTDQGAWNPPHRLKPTRRRSGRAAAPRRSR